MRPQDLNQNIRMIVLLLALNLQQTLHNFHLGIGAAEGVGHTSNHSLNMCTCMCVCVCVCLCAYKYSMSETYSPVKQK